MSIVLASKNKGDFEKIHINELLLLKPISCDMPKKIRDLGSLVQAIITIYYPGISRSATKASEMNWSFDLYQPGIIDTIDIDVNSTLYTPDSFYNSLFNVGRSDDPIRKIIPLSEKKSLDKSLEKKVKIIWGNIGRPEPEPVPVSRLIKLDSNKRPYDKIKNNEIGIWIEDVKKGNYSKITMFGKDVYSSIFRFSYINSVATEMKTEDDMYFSFSNGDIEYFNKEAPTKERYYLSERYFFQSPKDIKNKIRDSMQDDIKDEFDMDIIDKNLYQDLTIAPRPHDYLYSYFFSSEDFIQQRMTERMWREEDLPERKTYVLNIMPRVKGEHYGSAFQMTATAQLQCQKCIYLKGAEKIKVMNKRINKMAEFMTLITPQDKKEECVRFLKEL